MESAVMWGIPCAVRRIVASKSCASAAAGAARTMRERASSSARAGRDMPGTLCHGSAPMRCLEVRLLELVLLRDVGLVLVLLDREAERLLRVDLEDGRLTRRVALLGRSVLVVAGQALERDRPDV